MPTAPDTLGPNAQVGDEITQDRLMGGAAVARQARGGYRVGLDAALLAACVEPRPGERVLEAGCGVGAGLIQAALRAPDARFTGVERDADARALASENLALNGLSARVEVRAGNVDAGFAASGLPAFDAAFANPPFFDDAAALRAPSPAKRGAWMADGGLVAWVDFLTLGVREGGRITLIHRTDRLADLLALLAPRAGSFRIRPVQPFADAAAKRVLVRAIRGGRAPLMLLPPLVLHDRGDPKPTARADAILRGAALSWEATDQSA